MQACFKVWSMHSASILAILCWELVKATYLYKKQNATCRIIVSTVQGVCHACESH